MKLSTKPDMAEVARRWEAFWQGEIIDRPLVLTQVAKDSSDPDEAFATGYRRYQVAAGLLEQRLSDIDRHLEMIAFPGDTVPMFAPDLGPDQWAAFFGAEIKFNPGSHSTNWVEPIVENWEDVLPLELDPENPTFRKMLDYARRLAEHGRGRYLVSQVDAHSNADALSALRGPQRFMMDFYDCPELVERAMNDMRRSYRPVHEAIEKAGLMGGERGYGHYGFWHSRPFQVIQSDVICMLSPGLFRRFVLPALEEEFSCHERAYFHLDGPGALKHLDDILAIPGRWLLQWVPGAGQKPNWQWLEILEKAQRAGKPVEIHGDGLDFDAIRQLHRRLDPALTVYRPDMKKESEVLELLDWLVKNT